MTDIIRDDLRRLDRSEDRGTRRLGALSVQQHPFGRPRGIGKRREPKLRLRQHAQHASAPAPLLLRQRDRGRRGARREETPFRRRGVMMTDIHIWTPPRGDADIAPTRFERIEHDGYLTIDAPWVVPALHAVGSDRAPGVGAGRRHLSFELRRAGLEVASFDLHRYANPLVPDIETGDIRRLTTLASTPMIPTSRSALASSAISRDYKRHHPRDDRALDRLRVCQPHIHSRAYPLRRGDSDCLPRLGRQHRERVAPKRRRARSRP